MIKLLSQRDKRWSAIKLGFGTTTIGKYGCTITCLSMFINTTPDIVNQKLKGVGGFTGPNRNLLIWSKIKNAFPTYTHVWRDYGYDNTRVKEAISKYGSCLVEVNGKPIGSPIHWVLYMGNKRLYDPWDGKEKPTKTYEAIGYSIIRKVS